MAATSLASLATPKHARRIGSGPWYVAAVVIGTALLVTAAITQPYNQNELLQIKFYGSTDPSEITGATRQPPLGPLLGAIFQHALGEGQLRQRLVPVLAGVGILILLAVLLHRLKLRWAGAFGLWVLALLPLFIRYGAYTRPYALPMFLMIVVVYATQRWFDEGRPRWLVIIAISAAALPLARVPEPIIFLVTLVATLACLSLTRTLAWTRTWPVMAIATAALAVVGYPMYSALASQTSNVYDPSISGIITRFDSGVAEIATFLLPLLGSWIPWWPLSLLVVLLAFILPESRKRLTRLWFFWPLLAAPVVFALAYHFLNPYSFEVRHYRPRMAMFFAVPYALLTVSLAATVMEGQQIARRMRVGICVLLGAALLTQLPGTAKTISQNHAADFGQVAEVLTEDLPDEAIVLYDTPSPVGRWRQPFNGKPRYMGDTPYVGQIASMKDWLGGVPKEGPVYILILDSRCASSVVCISDDQSWRHSLYGWKVKARFDRFTLYEPTRSLDGREGTSTALEELGKAMGPRLGYHATFTAAKMLQQQGRTEHGKKLVEKMYQDADPQVAKQIRKTARNRDIEPFA